MLLPLAGLLAAQLLAHAPVPNAPAPPPRSLEAVDQSGDLLPPYAVGRLGTRRFQHRDGVSAAAWSPDGRVLATSGGDGEVALWEMPSGRTLRRLTVWPSAVQALAFSPDGKWLAACGSQFRVWNLSSFKEAILYSFPARQPLLTFSPNSKYVAILDTQNRVRVWELRLGFPASRYEGPRESVEALAVNDYNDVRAVTIRRGAVWLMTYPRDRTGKIVMEPKNPIRGVAFSADARTLAVAASEQLTLFDAATGKELQHLSTGPNLLGTPSLSADGSHAAAVGNDNTFRVWDVTSGKELLRLDGLAGQSSVSLSPDGKTLAAGSSGVNAVQLWDVATGQPLPRPPTHTQPIGSMAISPDGKYAATAAPHGDPAARLWDARTGKLIRDFRGPGSGVRSVAFSPDGRFLLTVQADNEQAVCLWSVASGDKMRAFQAAGTVTQAVFTPDGAGIVAAVLREKDHMPFTTVHLWDRETGMEMLKRSSAGSLGNIGVAPDGRSLFAAGDGVRRWETKSGRERPWPAATALPTIRQAVLSPDGRWFALAHDGPQTEIRETLTQRSLLTVAGGESAAFSPDGRFLAVAVQKDIHLIDLANSSSPVKLQGHDDAVCCLAFSFDGQRLFSGSADATALVWDVSALVRRPLRRREALNANQLDKTWTDLASPEARLANRAGWELVAAGEATVALLQAKLQVVTADQRQRIPRLIAALDADTFEMRENASKELASLIEEARDALQDALAMNPNAEMRRRLRELLAGERDRVVADSTRSLRAVFLLERIGTTDARALLKKLAAGAPDAILTQQAAAALTRLSPER